MDRQKKKSRKWSLGQGENVKDPAHPHFPNQSPPPTHTPHRVKTAMQAPLVQMGRKRKQTKAKVLFSTPYGEKKKRIRFADINTSEHIISSPFLSPRPNDRFSSVQTGWWVCGVCVGRLRLRFCPLHTFINRNYVTEFFFFYPPSMNYRQPTSTSTVQDLGRASKGKASVPSSEVITENS